MSNKNSFTSPKIIPLEIKIVRNTNIEEFGKGIDYLSKPFFLYVNGEEIKDVARFSIDLDKDEICKSEILQDWKYHIEKLAPLLRHPSKFCVNEFSRQTKNMLKQ